MEVADEIVVVNQGRVDQVGTPDQLYDEPANDFVMGFLGEITTLGGVVLRPHDIEVDRGPGRAGAHEAVVTRVLRVGFEVRVSAETTAGEQVTVLMTRTHAKALEVVEGATLWLTAAVGAATVPSMPARLSQGVVA